MMHATTTPVMMPTQNVSVPHTSVRMAHHEV